MTERTKRSSPETKVEKLVGSNRIPPSQCFDSAGSCRFSAEQRLMLALLTDAINVYQRGVLSSVSRKRLLYLDAERWIMARDASTKVFSFEMVCEALAINPATLRRSLIGWKHRALHEPEPATAPHLRIKTTPRERRMSRLRHRQRSGR